LNKLRVSVADTGIGMNEKGREGLFSRVFERGANAKNFNVNGKGIGLYLAAQMIVNNGGAIRVESGGLGKGSEFIIELPTGNSGKIGKPADLLLRPPVAVKGVANDRKV
jgi:signal transduction histidine kinase